MTRKMKEFLEAYDRSLGNVSTACRAVGITRRTFYNWKNGNEVFRQSIEELDAYNLDFAETMLMKHIREGDTTSLIFYLKTKGRERGYVERVEATGANGSPLVAAPVVLTDEQAAELLRKLESE
jgi:hypothetical protein